MNKRKKKRKSQNLKEKKIRGYTSEKIRMK